MWWDGVRVFVVERHCIFVMSCKLRNAGKVSRNALGCGDIRNRFAASFAGGGDGDAANAADFAAGRSRVFERCSLRCIAASGASVISEGWDVVVVAVIVRVL